MTANLYSLTHSLILTNSILQLHNLSVLREYLLCNCPKWQHNKSCPYSS